MKNQSSILVGFLLIVLGTVFLLIQFFPGLSQLINFAFLWPLLPLGLGIIFFISGLLANPPLLIPGTILSGIGGILFVSNTFDWWDFWQLWLLVPSLAGLGIILMQLRSGRGMRSALMHGGPPLAVGGVLFLVFTAIFSPFSAVIWPVALIALGMIWLLRSLFVRRMS